MQCFLFIPYLRDVLLSVGGCTVCFHLYSNGGKDVFWQSRDNALLIKGGANYSYDQINDDLTKFLIVKSSIFLAQPACCPALFSSHLTISTWGDLFLILTSALQATVPLSADGSPLDPSEDFKLAVVGLRLRSV